ncbi:hypothetical protein KKD03_05150 [Patescibacteria group bacterium]|nr:hypothetical protein [Patescibacteria group bacterium]
MLTSLDIKKLQSVFATKEDLKGFVTKEDLKDLEHRFLFSLDKVMNELKGIREDLTAGTHRSSQNSKKIENHEERISSVEESLYF